RNDGRFAGTLDFLLGLDGGDLVQCRINRDRVWQDTLDPAADAPLESIDIYGPDTAPPQSNNRTGEFGFKDIDAYASGEPRPCRRSFNLVAGRNNQGRCSVGL